MLLKPLKLVSLWMLMICSLLGVLSSKSMATHKVVLLEINRSINPAMQDYVHRGIEYAVANKASFIILQLDTPGGLDQSMRGIIRDILASPLPVVGYVAPEGARAASAGTYILYACHIAAMAHATHVGAATPISIGGDLPFPAMPPKEDDKKEPKKP